MERPDCAVVVRTEDSARLRQGRNRLLQPKARKDGHGLSGGLRVLPELRETVLVPMDAVCRADVCVGCAVEVQKLFPCKRSLRRRVVHKKGMMARTERRARIVIDRRDVAKDMVGRGGMVHRAVNDAADRPPLLQSIANLRRACRLADDLHEPSMLQREAMDSGELLPPAFPKSRLKKEYDVHDGGNYIIYFVR